MMGEIEDLCAAAGVLASSILQTQTSCVWLLFLRTFLCQQAVNDGAQCRARLEISALPRASLHLRSYRRKQVASGFCFCAPSCASKLSPEVLKTKQEHTNVCSWKFSAAERARFELAVGLPLRQFSKLLVSATHPPFRLVHF